MRDNLRKIISVIIGIIVLSLLILIITNFVRGGAPFETSKEVSIQKKTFKVKVAESEKDKEIGLSQTKKLPDNYGMLFPFEQDGYHAFWMRDMKFPIDIIFINDNKIVKIFSNVPAPKDPTQPLQLYLPPAPSDSVLEIKGGLSEKYKIKEGDTLSLKDK